MGSSTWFDSSARSSALAATVSGIVSRLDGASILESVMDEESGALSRDERRERGREAKPSRDAVLERGGGETGEIPKPSGQPVTPANAAAAGETGLERLVALLGVLARE